MNGGKIKERQGWHFPRSKESNEDKRNEIMKNLVSLTRIDTQLNLWKKSFQEIQNGEATKSRIRMIKCKFLILGWGKERISWKNAADVLRWRWCKEDTFYVMQSKFIIPMHTCPVPLYPSLHVHSYEPLVFTQVAFTPQMMLEFAHSSISKEKR